MDEAQVATFLAKKWWPVLLGASSEVLPSPSSSVEAEVSKSPKQNQIEDKGESPLYSHR